MKRCLTLAMMGVVLLGVLGMAARPPLVGNPSPEIVLKDLQGHKGKRSELRGKIVLLNFWATY